jgi:hypothetical protein
MKSQAGFQLTGIDEEGTPLKRLGAKATIAVLAHRRLSPNFSANEVWQRLRSKVNAVRGKCAILLQAIW